MQGTLCFGLLSRKAWCLSAWMRRLSCPMHEGKCVPACRFLAISIPRSKWCCLARVYGGRWKFAGHATSATSGTANGKPLRPPGTMKCRSKSVLPQRRHLTPPGLARASKLLCCVGSEQPSVHLYALLFLRIYHQTDGGFCLTSSNVVGRGLVLFAFRWMAMAGRFVQTRQVAGADRLLPGHGDPCFPPSLQARQGLLVSQRDGGAPPAAKGRGRLLPSEEGFSYRAHVKTDLERIAREHKLIGGASIRVSPPPARRGAERAMEARQHNTDRS
jgi:hypothetical protein